jgi:imidazole glycerol phosphate synthase glutamine amidotransferase subunit
MIGIIDYGAGNLRSVKKAIDYLQAPNRIVRSPADFNGIEKIILPGVGAFQSAIEKLKEKDLFLKTKAWLHADRPFLGICLGMQVLFESSEEAPGGEGFGLFRGQVLRFQERKVPQIGWNQVLLKRDSSLMQSIRDNSFFYFLHGYYVKSESQDIVVGATEYGLEYPSVIQSGRIAAVQFHPEKSADNGLKLLKNWLAL